MSTFCHWCKHDSCICDDDPKDALIKKQGERIKELEEKLAKIEDNIGLFKRVVRCRPTSIRSEE